MKWLLYIGILVGIWLIPVQGTDVGRLIPVEVVAVSKSSGIFTVRTDTENTGVGQTLEAAVKNLEDTSPGVIYLDTAEYLLAEPGCDLKEIKLFLKESVQVCRAEESIALDGIADFLSVHKPGIRLDQVTNADGVPQILEENGHYHLNRK